MTHERALAFWYGRINYELRPPRPGDLKLDRMRALLRALGDPQDRLRIVHVAGSKGKGSTSAMLASVLGRAGYHTGLFTSPHLTRVEERFQVDGVPITAEEFTALIAEIRPAVQELDRQPDGAAVTFFEIATALGFLHFVRRRVDLAVIEVGLGGRFDSTNVCLPRVAVITSISLDHTQQLGDRLSSIAMEKAGIIKPGRPAVSGATDPAARAVIEETARRRRAPLRQLGVEFRYRYEPGCMEPWRPPRVQVFTERRTWPVAQLGLLGEHQAANAAVAVACVEELQADGLCIPDDAVTAGLAAVSWPARLEVVGRRPLVVLDCAHNVASAQALVDTLGASLPPVRRGEQRLLVFAASSDKDLPGMLRLLAPQFARVFLTRYGNSPRSAPPEQLARMLAAAADVPHAVCPTALDAWQQARAVAGPEDLICITGSVFLAGELREAVRTASSSLAAASGETGRA
jgi:dihydrofolate synthase/folylpolyglutamate synthase